MSAPSVAEETVDVVILGAGVAGLVAARRLCDRGLQVVVVESRDRVGGRLHSSTDGDGNRFDLGATWCWPGEHHIAALIDELGIRTHPHYLDGDALYHDPAIGSKRLDGNPIDVPSYRFTDGASSITDSLASQLPDGVLRLSSPAQSVTSIEIPPGEVLRVEHAGGYVNAKHVIVALPPALAIDRIRFTPPLPPQVAGLAGITPVWMGAIAKVVARYPTAFWRTLGLSGSAFSHVGPMRELHDMSGPDGHPAALFGFAPLAANNPPPTHNQIRRQLAEIFGSNAPHPTELIVVDWRSDPDTSPPGVEALGAYETFGHDLYQSPALEGRLHWASTETSPINPGHIDGAVFAAERAAQEVFSRSDRSPV